MEDMSIILFLCVVLPILPVLILLPDRRSRCFLAFLVGGIAVCLVAAAVNTILLYAFNGGIPYVTSNITPVSEEILKALPILCYAWMVSDDRDTLISASFAMGLGFALLENLLILLQNPGSVTILWAFVRGLGAAFMHSICTSMIGMGICYIRKRRKLFFCGTFSLLITAIIYHAIFNSLIQSQYRIIGFIMPTLLCIPLYIYHRKKETGSS